MTSDLETLIERTRANVAKLQDDLRFEQRLLSRLIGEKSQQPNKRDVANVPQAPARPRMHLFAHNLVNGSLMSQVGAIFHTENRALTIPEIKRKLEANGFATNCKGGLRVAICGALFRGRKIGLLEKTGRGLYVMKPQTENQPK